MGVGVLMGKGLDRLEVGSCNIDRLAVTDNLAGVLDLIVRVSWLVVVSFAGDVDVGASWGRCDVIWKQQAREMTVNSSRQEYLGRYVR